MLNYIDISIATVIAVSLLISMRRGVVKEVVSLATWVLAVFGVFNYTDVLAEMLSGYIANPPLRTLVGVIIVILGIFIVGKIINKLLGAIIADSWFGPFDKIIGLAFGVFRGVVVVSIIIVSLNMLGVNYHKYVKGSVLISQFEDMARFLQKMVDDNYDSLKNNYFNKVPKQKLPEVKKPSL